MTDPMFDAHPTRDATTTRRLTTEMTRGETEMTDELGEQRASVSSKVTGSRPVPVAEPTATPVHVADRSTAHSAGGLPTAPRCTKRSERR